MNVSELIAYIISILDSWGFQYYLAAAIIVAVAIKMLEWLGVLKD